MPKFHITDNGEPAPCNAQPGNCPKGEDQPHFDSEEEAQNHIETKMSSQPFPSVSKTNKDPLKNNPLLEKGFNADKAKPDNFDATINELESKKIAAQLEQDNQLSIINREYNERELVKTNGQSKYEWTKSQKEVLEDLKNDKSDDGQKLRDQLKEKATNLKKLERTINALNSKFVERGGWNRAFLATSGGDGHVHNSTDCSTCNKGKTPTQFQWMTNYSGSDEKSIVDDAGYRACTVCYPSAPIGDAKSLPTKMLSEEEKEKQIARDERKQKAADKAQKAKDNAPTASGEPLKIRSEEHTS